VEQTVSINRSQVSNIAPRFSAAIPTIPTIVTLELTTLCNQFCSGCANVELPRQKALRNKHATTMVNWKEIIDTVMVQTGKKVIIRLSGGEPTLHPQFVDIVQYIDKLNVPYTLLTTGKWGNSMKTNNLIKLFKNCNNFVGMLVSLHGSNAAMHNAFVESSEKGYAEILNNIQLATQNGLRVFTNTVLTSLNYNQIDNILQIAQQHGATYSVFNRFIGDNHPLQLTEEQLIEAIQRVKILRGGGTACRIGNSIPSCFHPMTNFPTVAGYELCHISPDGRVRPDNLTSFHFGNILKEKLTDIWQSDNAKAYRNWYPSVCRQCAAFSACRGSVKSPYFKTLQRGDTLIKDPLTLEQTQPIDDDKEKRRLDILALTSD
jgi:radical SAM protein with 4Fe4S-binding SPASM domain